MRVVGVSMTGALAALAAFALMCPSALAQTPVALEPGVHVDPGSPAAKEYALPLNQARQTGAVPSSRASSPEAALFGAGIKPPGSGGGSPRGGSGARGASHSAAPVSGAGAAGAAGTLPAAVLRATRSPSGSSGGGSTLALVGGGVAILVLGGFGGTVLRHSRRPTPTS